MEGQKVRKLALYIITDTMEKGAKLNEELLRQQEIYQYLPKKERAFLNRLARGCVERCLTLDYVINRYSSRNTEKMKPLIRNILRMGTYEILFMEKVPDRAACNEAVALAKKKGFSGLSGFVNGILRKIASEKEEISGLISQDAEDLSSLSAKDFKAYMERIYSIPDWLSEYWEEAYGREMTRKMAEDFLREKETAIRVNTLKTGIEELKKKLEENGIHTENGIYSPYALRISGYDHIGGMDGFLEGLFQIQDESSMLSVLASGIEERVKKAGKQKIKVLDVCGAPGGKGLFYAQLLGDRGSVEIRDISERKLMLIEENASRLGIDNINIKEGDAAEPEEGLIKLLPSELFDIVAADLPCSGLGVIGKKCDIKYRLSMWDIKELAGLQRRILSCVKNYVKKGGVMIYSTCTLSPVENEENAEWFLREYPEFKPYDIGRHLNKELVPYGSHEGVKNMLRLFPGESSTDGFFIAGFILA